MLLLPRALIMVSFFVPGGGLDNVALGVGTTVVGGDSNTAVTRFSSIIGGDSNYVRCWPTDSSSLWFAFHLLLTW